MEEDLAPKDSAVKRIIDDTFKKRYSAFDASLSADNSSLGCLMDDDEDEHNINHYDGERSSLILDHEDVEEAQEDVLHNRSAVVREFIENEMMSNTEFGDFQSFESMDFDDKEDKRRKRKKKRKKRCLCPRCSLLQMTTF